jgi:bifunctional DNA-binding transcriptional regulator/antitoxin component of YhaV-PrlF toxin-antitoxin module
MTKYTIDIREKRQATFPSNLLQELGIGVGDSLEIIVEKDGISLKTLYEVVTNVLPD